MLKITLQENFLKAGKAMDLDGERKHHPCFLPFPRLQNEVTGTMRMEQIQRVL